MEQFFAFLGVGFALLGLMLLLRYFYYNNSVNTHFIENQRVYEAAELFAADGPDNEVRDLLTKCLDLDEEDAAEIIKRAAGNAFEIKYSAFLGAVNNVLGKDIYSTKPMKTV